MQIKLDGKGILSRKKVWEEQHKDPKVEELLKQLAERNNKNKKIEQEFDDLEDKSYNKKTAF